MSSEFLHGVIPRLSLQNTNIALVNNAGQFLSGGTLHLFIQGRNRSGYTELSAAIAPITYTATQAIQISFPAAARTPATDFHYYVLSHSPTGNPTNAIALCRWTNYESDQLTPRPLTPFTLYRDEHIAIAPSAATPADLPTGIDLLSGMSRLVVGGVPTSAYYQYDPYEVRSPNGTTILQPHPGEKWVRTGSPNVGLVTDITDTDGCARPIQTVSADSLILPPTYPADGGTPIKGTPLKLIWRNDSSSVLPAGTAFNLGVTMDGSQASDLFDGKLMVTPRGFVNLANGSLDTSDGLGGTMPDIDGDIPYKYGDRTTLFLYKDLPVGWAYFIEVAAYFTVEQLQGRVLEGSQISISFALYSQAGDAAYAIWKVVGDIVLSDSDRLRVVPGVGLSARVLSGSALVQRFVFPPKGDRAVYGLQSGIANQKITVDGNGSLFCRGTGVVPGTEAVRAIVSCITGYSTASAWSNSVAIASGGAIAVTLSYPCDENGLGTIRSNYPTIASNSKGRFNPPYVKLFVRQQSDGKIFQLSTNVTVLADEEQTVSVGSLSNAVEINALPSTSASDFCLFDPPDVAIASSSGGSLSADAYQIASAYYFDGSAISSISHNPQVGCLPELAGTFEELLNHIDDTNNPHQVTATQVGSTVAQWNASQLMGRAIAETAPTDKQAYWWSETDQEWIPGSAFNSFPALKLQLVSEPPETEVNEIALFALVGEARPKYRKPSNGEILELSSPYTPPEGDDDDMAVWQIKDANYTATGGEKLLVLNSNDPIITLPTSPAIGSEIKFISYNVGGNNGQANIALNGASYRGNSSEPDEFYVKEVHTLVSLVYTGETFGWIPSSPDAIEVVYSE